MVRNAAAPGMHPGPGAGHIATAADADITSREITIASGRLRTAMTLSSPRQKITGRVAMVSHHSELFVWLGIGLGPKRFDGLSHSTN